MQDCESKLFYLTIIMQTHVTHKADRTHYPHIINVFD